MASPFIFAAALASLLVYVLVARTSLRSRRAGPAQLPRDYFLARQRYGGEEFAASQIAYQLQMSTVYPFVLWAATGDWILALCNTFFYLIGIGLFLLLIKHFTRNSTTLVGSSKTLHAFIAQTHGSPTLRHLTAWMSVIAFAGMAVFEIVFGAKAFKVLFGGSSTIFYISIATLSAYLIVYFWVGGQGATIRTDQYQLLLGYIGLHALVAWCVSRPVVNARALAAPFLVTWTLALAVIMLVWRLTAWRGRQRARYLLVLNLFTLASVVVLVAYLGRAATTVWHDALFVPRPTPTDPHAFPWQLITLALLPLFFQFVDMTNWQRIASLKETAEVRRGLLQYLLESPLSWLFPVLIGLSLPAILGKPLPDDAWEALLKRLYSDNSATGILLASIVMVAIIAIFMSTAESLISAIGFAYAYDLNPRTRALVDANDEERLSNESRELVISVGRRAMAIILSIVVMLFVMVDVFQAQGERFLGLFLACFTPMLAFAPAVLTPAVIRRRASPFWAWVSLGGGSAVGLGIGVASVFLGGLSQWLAAPAAFVVSWLAYAIGILSRRETTA